MDNLNDLQSLGFTMPSPAYLIGVILFSFIGIAAYMYGKSTARPPLRWVGVALMLYPYVVSETWLMYLVGVGLCGALYWYRN